MVTVLAIGRRCVRAVVLAAVRVPVTGLLAVATLAWLAALMTTTHSGVQPVVQPRPVVMSTALAASPMGGDDGGGGGCGGGGLGCGGGISSGWAAPGSNLSDSGGELSQIPVKTSGAAWHPTDPTSSAVSPRRDQPAAGAVTPRGPSGGSSAARAGMAQMLGQLSELMPEIGRLIGQAPAPGEASEVGGSVPDGPPPPAIARPTDTTGGAEQSGAADQTGSGSLQDTLAQAGVFAVGRASGRAGTVGMTPPGATGSGHLSAEVPTDQFGTGGGSGSPWLDPATTNGRTSGRPSRVDPNSSGGSGGAGTPAPTNAADRDDSLGGGARNQSLTATADPTAGSRRITDRLDSLTGPRGPDPSHTTLTNSAASTSGDQDSGSTSTALPAFSGAAHPRDTTADTTSTTNGSAPAKLVDGGLQVPTTDGGTLGITPTSSVGPHASLTPDVANNRYLITAQDAQAPNAYNFSLSMPTGSRVVPNRTGGIDVINTAGQTTQTIAAPWARDATGAAVPTHFTVAGNTLTQHIDPGPDSIYPILADPAAAAPAGGSKPAPSAPAPKPAPATGTVNSSGVDKTPAPAVRKPAPATGTVNSSGVDKTPAPTVKKPTTDTGTVNSSGVDKTPAPAVRKPAPATGTVNSSGVDKSLPPPPGSTGTVNSSGVEKAYPPVPSASSTVNSSGVDRKIVRASANSTVNSSGVDTTFPPTPAASGTVNSSGVDKTIIPPGSTGTVNSSGVDKTHPPSPDTGTVNSSGVDKIVSPTATSTVNSSGVDKYQAPTVVNADGKPYQCASCSGRKIILGSPPSTNPAPGGTQPAMPNNPDIVVLNPGSTTVTGNNVTITGGSGDNRHVRTIGSGNTIDLGGGSGNQVSALGGDNNTASVGNGNHNHVTADGGNNNKATAGGGNQNQAVTGPGSHNSATVGNGDANRAIAGYGDNNLALTGAGNGNGALTGAGNGNHAQVGDGNHSTATAGRGNNNLAMVGNGDSNRALTGAGNGNQALGGNGSHNQITTGVGNNNTAMVGDGQSNRVTTGAGNGNQALGGDGDNNQITAGKGSNNTAAIGTGDHNQVITGAGNNNTAMALGGNHNQVIAGGPGSHNTAFAGPGDGNRAITGQGDDNTAITGAGNGNLTRTGAGNNNATHTGPGTADLTQLGSGTGNTANSHPVAPGNYRPFGPQAEPAPPPAVTPPPGQPGQTAGAPGQTGTGQTGANPAADAPLFAPWVKPVESGIQNYLGKYNRYARTLRDAATRHLIASNQMDNLGNSLRSSDSSLANRAANLTDRYGAWRASQAQWYGARSQRLSEIGGQRLDNTPLKDVFKRNVTTVWDPDKGAFIQGRVGRMGITNLGVQGHLPADANDPMRVGWRKALPTQRLLSSTLADRFNRWSANPLNPLATAKPNPATDILDNPAVKAAKQANPDFPVTTNMLGSDGLRVTETLRRGLTKVAAPVSLAFGVADVINQVKHGTSLGSAIGKTGSGILVSGAASAATTALLGTAAASALVPGAGWAIAGGIVVGIGASYAWDKLGGSALAAKVGDQVGKGLSAAGGGIAEGAKNAWKGTEHFFGGLSHVFG